MNVGGMGHTSQISLGLAVSLPDKQRVVCLDGDGSFIMHMGGVSTIGDIKPKNYIHFILNNKTHESVGGQYTSARNTNFQNIAKYCGYKKTYGGIDNVKKLKNVISKIKNQNGPILIDINIEEKLEENLPRPEKNLKNYKKLLQKFLNVKQR